MYVIYVVLCTVLCKLAVTGELLHPISDQFIDLIKKEEKWRAGRSFPSNTPMKHTRRFMSILEDLSKDWPTVKHESQLIANLPESFDPRDKWPNCPTLNEIRDQGQCGACWAFGAVEAMTDRVCIYSNGTKNFHFSAQDIVTCNADGSGCGGGEPKVAWEEWVNVGLVSGGNYNSHQGCKPFRFAPCANHLKKCIKFKPTPTCVHACDDGYNKTYENDRKRGKKIYQVEGEEDIMAEMYKNGPVEAFFRVYKDFADYKGGVYQHLKGGIIFDHAVKMMGWGVENGTKYWLVANSWGTGFGENGFFKILRGTNECYIEEVVFAGEPLLEDY